MKTLLRQFLLLLLTRQILAIWWLFPRDRFPHIPPLREDRWIISSKINSGTSQSPIDIDDFTVVNCPTINYNLNYDNETLARFENNGDTVKVLVEGKKPTLSGGPLTGEYVFQEVHFHWGTNDNEGSEHTKNGFRYPMETHVVHYNSKYGSFQESLKHKDGLAIFGIVFDILPYRNSNFKDYDNAMMLPLTSHLEDIPTKNASVELNANDLLQWLWPFVAKDHYFTYTGSLTTSPFSEVATWIIYDAVIPMSEKQIEEFRQRNTEGNFRQVQPRNGRIVYYCDSQSTRKPRFWPSP